MNVRFGSLADIGQPIRDVRFAPESGHVQRRNRCLLCAKSRHQSLGITEGRQPTHYAGVGELILSIEDAFLRPARASDNAHWPTWCREPIALLVFARRVLLNIDRQRPVIAIFKALSAVANGVTVDRIFDQQPRVEIVHGPRRSRRTGRAEADPSGM